MQCLLKRKLSLASRHWLFSVICTQPCEDLSPAEMSSQNTVFPLGMEDKEKGLYCHGELETMGPKIVSKMAQAVGSVPCGHSTVC